LKGWKKDKRRCRDRTSSPNPRRKVLAGTGTTSFEQRACEFSPSECNEVLPQHGYPRIAKQASRPGPVWDGKIWIIRVWAGRPPACAIASLKSHHIFAVHPVLKWISGEIRAVKNVLDSSHAEIQQTILCYPTPIACAIPTVPEVCVV
jgi:hypothetical protein